LIDLHESTRAAATMLTAAFDDPQAYGRVVRNSAGDVVAIVEARDATTEQLAIREVNTSVYVFDTPSLRDALDEIRPDNDQGEFYLTDVIGILVGQGRTVAATAVDDPGEGHGVNTIAELEAAGAQLIQRRGAI